MNSYKDVERTSPEELAEFILKERTCKNCKHYYGFMDNLECKNPNIIVLDPSGTFGCNQWEKKVE